MLDQKTTKRVARFLVYLISLTWLGLGMVTAAGLHPALPAGPVYRWGLAALSFLTGLGLVVLYHLIQNQLAFPYYFFVGILTLISVSFVFDEIGWIDVTVFILHLVLILLVVRDRDAHLQGTVPEG